MSDSLNEKMDAMDIPGAVISFDPDEAEALGFSGEGQDDTAWVDALLSSSF